MNYERAKRQADTKRWVALGLAVSHREFGLTPDRLSLIQGKGEMRELRQFGFAPSPLCSLGTCLVYFKDEIAYALDPSKADDIDGTADLIMCRGPAVFRYSRATGRTERIGMGRSKMKLNGAAIANGDLFTWSSRTWITTGHSCSLAPISRPYLYD